MRKRQPLKGCLLTLWASGLCAVLCSTPYPSFAQTQQVDRNAETAMAVQRPVVRGQSVAALPHPLAPSDALRLRRILALHAAGLWTQAASETDALDAPWMLGAIQADRYRALGYQPTAAALTLWLTQYDDLPEAPFIRTMLDRAAPQPARDNARVAVNDRLAQRVRGLFTQNRDAEAVSAAMPLLHTMPDSRADAGDALFVAGLAAWRLDQVPVAQTFLQAAHARSSTGHLRAASAYWLATAARHARNLEQERLWLRRAAQETDTFHAWIAHKQLGATHECVAGGTLGNADLDALSGTPGGQRAFAWLQAGEKARAEQELRAVWYETQPDPAMARALYLVANAAGLPAFAGAIRTGGAASRLAAERQPLETLSPASGFLIDPPLVYALVRRESNFAVSARSSAGARGLMQIMPATAQATGVLENNDPDNLDDPAINLDVGQKYLLQLAGDKVIGGNLLRMLAAYEQGQFAMRRWVGDIRDGGDPLMFLEAIPNQATRLYVEQTLTHAWRYAARFRLTSDSLNALAAQTYPTLTRAKVARPKLEATPANCQPAGR